MARKYNIPQKNGGQILKAIAEKKGGRCYSTGQKRQLCTTNSKEEKKLAGGEVSTPCLPTIKEITEEKHQLIESGELSLGEPCTPYTIKKSSASSTGEIQIKQQKFMGVKFPSTS